MGRKLVSIILAAALGLQCGSFLAFAQGAGTAANDDGYGGAVTRVDGVEYVNGVEADYDDPGYYKYVEGLEDAYDSVDVSQYAAGTGSLTTSWGKTTYTHDSKMAGSAKNISMGVDVSKWNGDIDWNKAAKAGVGFAMIRIGNRGTADGSLNKDSSYATNMKNAQAAGIATGIYFYSQAITVQEAKAEANFVLNNLDGYIPDLPIFIDFEYFTEGSSAYGRLKPSLPKATKTAICNAFCQVIEDAGYEAGIYASASVYAYDLNFSDIKTDYSIWVAEWKNKVTYDIDHYSYWQCSCKATVAGIGTVDLNWGYGIDDYDGNIIEDGGKLVYVDDDGKRDTGFDGFAKRGNRWYYVEEGVVSTSTNSVVRGTVNGKSAWWYVVGGQVQKSFTGLADYKNANGWWYIKNGKVDFSANTVAKNKNGWWYVVGGKVQFDFTGLADYSNANGWWYIKNGKVDFAANTVAKNKNGWWYVVGGKVQFDFTGLANYKNENGWWFIRNGKVDFTFAGIAQNKNGWWYVKNGKVQTGFTGTATADGKKYQVTKGRVNK